MQNIFYMNLSLPDIALYWTVFCDITVTQLGNWKYKVRQDMEYLYL